MKSILGNPQRLIRIIIAVVIAVLYFTGVITGILAIVLLVIGSMMLLTSLLNYCPTSGVCPRDHIRGLFTKKDT